MWSKLGVRLISAFIGAAFVIGLIFAPIQFFIAGIALVIYVVLFEYNRTIYKENKKRQLMVLEYLAATVSVFLAVRFGEQCLAPVFAAYVMITFICAIIVNKAIKLSDVLTAVFALVYAVFPLVYIIFIRSGVNGTATIFLALLGAWMPDTFAYFSGLLFGKHKLIPSISPKKTVEGAIGAVFGSVLSFVLYGSLLSYLGYSVRYVPLIILAFICGILAQFGDLSASLIKRQYDVKDFGNIMPGHGGLLDRIDSLIFIAPLTYYFLLFMPVIG